MRSSCRFLRSLIRSQVILPLHSSTRSTLSASTVESGITGRKLPSVKSLGLDMASFLRSIDFGVKTMSGRCSSPSEWRRSRWK